MDMMILLDHVSSITEAEAEALLAKLEPGRRVRIGAMSRSGARRLSLLGEREARRAAARLLSVTEDAVPIQDGPGGQPCIAGGNACISITHAGDYAAAAAALRPVGLDLERIRPISAGVLRRVCSTVELDYLSAATDALRPLLAIRLWTMKEAWGKRLGVGVFTSQRFFCALENGRLQTAYPDCVFTFHDAPPGYLLTSCLSRDAAKFSE